MISAVFRGDSWLLISVVYGEIREVLGLKGDGAYGLLGGYFKALVGRDWRGIPCSQKRAKLEGIFREILECF